MNPVTTCFLFFFDTGRVVDPAAISAGKKFNAFILSAVFFSFFLSHFLFAFDLDGNENRIIQELCMSSRRKSEKNFTRHKSAE